MRAAMERRDTRAVVRRLRSRCESPFAADRQADVQGPEQIAGADRHHPRRVGELRCTDEIMGDEDGFLVGRAKVDGLETSSRPLPAAAAALRRIGARLGRRKSLSAAR